MYCKNCGTATDDKDSICINCGTPAGYGDLYCRSCGTAVNQGDVICNVCGCSLNNNNNTARTAVKSKTIAGLSGIFLGFLGMHNFYLGYVKKGTVQMLMTVLSCGILGMASEIWGLVEGILILTGTIDTDAQGNPLRE